MRPRNCLEYFVVPEIKEALGKQGGWGGKHMLAGCMSKLYGAPNAQSGIMTSGKQERTSNDGNGL
jgi:hypothetical protein